MEYKISVITPTIRPESLSIMRDCLKAQTFKEFEWLVDINITGDHDLNAAFNRLIKRSTGELVVFYEDYTRIPPDALQKWWDAYKLHPDTCFTGPLGKVKEWGDKPNWDWRAHQITKEIQNFVLCRWDTCELDWGAIPRKILVEIGGFDEELDKYWSCDNVNLGCRAELAGYKFLNYFRNPAVAYDHDAHMPHPFREKFNPGFNKMRMDEFREGVKIDYLS